MGEKAIEEQELSQAEIQQSGRLALADCGKTLWARRVSLVVLVVREA
jgi:hypothetical protein